MEKYQETSKTWNKVAKIYEDKFMNIDLYNDTYDVFLDLIPGTNAHVLEIGCGPGNITQYLLSHKPDLKVTGIDISENMIELAKKNNPSADFKVMDARKVDTLKNQFDAIVCGFCIPYLSQADCEKLISDCKRLLKDSGILYLSFVEGNYEHSGFISGSSGDRTFFYYHSLDYLKNELMQNSFETQKVLTKEYEKADKTIEIHTILILK